MKITSRTTPTKMPALNSFASKSGPTNRQKRVQTAGSAGLATDRHKSRRSSTDSFVDLPTGWRENFGQSAHCAFDGSSPSAKPTKIGVRGPEKADRPRRVRSPRPACGYGGVRKDGFNLGTPHSNQTKAWSNNMVWQTKTDYYNVDHPF
jgi:hypothetical protein